jgi:5-methylcytosine-specific restriction protein A
VIGRWFRVARSILRERRKAKDRRWRLLRDQFLRVHPRCAACGTARRPQVHHIAAARGRLDAANLITLCMGPLECHERLGHGGRWKASNPRILTHAREVYLYPLNREAVEEEARLAAE